MIRRGVAICHYNRLSNLAAIIQSVKDTVPNGTRVVVCDDGSKGNVGKVCRDNKVVLVQGPNRGVAYNKNRGLWALQDCHFAVLLEDDLMPVEKNWFEVYEQASILSGFHYFCRVQDKQVGETVPEFSSFMNQYQFTPIYGSSPRGDLTFLTYRVIKEVGAFNPKFKGAGYAHGEHFDRVLRAGLVHHPLKYIDIQEARDKFKQIGDTKGGRWNEGTKVKKQIETNREILKELQQTEYIYCPLELA